MQDSTSAPLTNRIDEHDDICRVAQLYIDGTANGDVSKLKEAFHDDARMFGGFLGSRYDVPIEHLFRQAASMPADTGRYRGRIISVSQAGDVAFAAVAEDGYWGTVSFVDYFLLTRIDGKWKITCKPSLTQVENRSREGYQSRCQLETGSNPDAIAGSWCGPSG
jgi:phage gp36-like protein